MGIFIHIKTKTLKTVAAKEATQVKSYVMPCKIWYHLYNLKNVKNTHGGVLLLVKLQTKHSSMGGFHVI